MSRSARARPFWWDISRAWWKAVVTNRLKRRGRPMIEFVKVNDLSLRARMMCETVVPETPNRMLKISIRCLIVLLLMPASLMGQEKQRDPLAATTEIIVVTTSEWNSPEGTLRRYERRTSHD